jgi:hypothetical protein
MVARFKLAFLFFAGQFYFAGDCDPILVFLSNG